MRSRRGKALAISAAALALVVLAAPACAAAEDDAGVTTADALRVLSPLVNSVPGARRVPPVELPRLPAAPAPMRGEAGIPARIHEHPSGSTDRWYPRRAGRTNPRRTDPNPGEGGVLMAERRVIVFPPAECGGRRVQVAGETVGTAFGTRDLAALSQHAGLEGVDDAAEPPVIERHGGGSEEWRGRRWTPRPKLIRPRTANRTGRSRALSVRCPGAHARCPRHAPAGCAGRDARARASADRAGRVIADGWRVSPPAVGSPPPEGEPRQQGRRGISSAVKGGKP